MAEDAPLLELARAVAEGATPDWDAAERSCDPQGRDVVAQLRVLARLADVQRRRDFGHYAELLPIGAGGFGEVFRARDTRLERDVALKFLPDASSLHEGRLLAQVRHAHVVSVHDVESFDGRSAVVMELVRGRTLHELLAERGPLHEDEARGFMADACEALAAVHAAGLVHGDVSARNVMVEPGGRVVLMDFGLGHRAGQAGAGLRGTRPYMAPELLQGQRPSVASDVYAVGVLLHQLRTGRFPTAGPPAGLGRLGPVIERCLAVWPAERYLSASELRLALRQRPGFGRRAPLLGATALGLTLVALALRQDAPPAARPSVVPAPSPSAAAPLPDPSPGPPQPDPSRRPSGDPFVRPLGPGPAGAGEGTPAEAGLLTIEARVHGQGAASELELRASEPFHVYVLREGEETTWLLFPLPGQRLRNPLEAGLAQRIPVGEAHGVLVLGTHQRLVPFEERVAALRVPRGASSRGVALPPDLLLLLRESLGLPARGRLLGRAAPLAGRLELLRGVWVRRLAPA